MSELTEFRDDTRAWLQENLPESLVARGEGYSGGTKETVQNPDTLRWFESCYEQGWTVPSWPKEFGGAELSSTQAKVLQLEMAMALAPTPLSGMGVTMIGPTLLEHGTDDQKSRHLGSIANGKVRWCQGYSEPNAGSDLASLHTRAVDQGDYYLINGSKIWTSGAQHADMIFCLVRTEPDAPKHQGISYFVFSMDTPGIEVRPLVTMTGEATFNEVFFTDVRVPKHQIIGNRGEGWFVANNTLKHEREGLGDPNQAENRFREIVDLMQRETMDSNRLIDNPTYRDRLLSLQGRMLAMKFNGMRVLTSQIKKEEPGLPRWIIKLQGCELNHQMAAMAIDSMGELGILYDDGPYLRDHGRWQQRYMMDLGLIIGGGTAQIQKNMIGERALGLPKEPKFEKPLN